MANDNEHAQLMHGIGRLTGSVDTMYAGLTTRIEDIKDELRRNEAAQKERMNQVEERLGKRIDSLDVNMGKRIDGLSGRVSALEAEDKKIIANVARVTALGGGLSGALVAGAIELLKKF